MAIVDFQTIFSDEQVVLGTTLSERSIDLQASADYAIGRNIYAHVLTQGDMSHDLRVQILGCNSTDFADVEVVGDSGVIPQADLTFGSDLYVQLVATGKKYRYVCLRYIPTNDGTAVTDSTAGTPPTTMPPVAKVGSTETAIANALRAQIEFVPAMDINYPYANEDKATN